MQRTSFEKHLIPILEPADYEAGVDGDSVDMSKLHRICHALLFGAVTGDAVLKFYAGATAGTKTTALAFNYRFSGGDFKAASADIHGSEVAVASTGLTLTAATFDHRHVTVDFESIDMPSGKPWLTMELSAAASVLLLACEGIGQPVYGGQTQPTAI